MSKIISNGQELVLSSRNGKSAYEIAVENGFEGSEQEWLGSLVGKSPHIGANGNWWIGDTDTGVSATANGDSNTSFDTASLGITQEEYDALPDKSGLYIITDADVESIQTVTENVDATNVIYDNTKTGLEPNSVQIAMFNGQPVGCTFMQSSAYIFGHGLTTIIDGTKTKIEVDVVNDFSGDKTLPMSAAGVETQIGNIGALLDII